MIRFYNMSRGKEFLGMYISATRVEILAVVVLSAIIGFILGVNTEAGYHSDLPTE